VRRSAILEWAKQSDDESLRAAAGRLDSGGGSTERSVEASDGVSARERPIDAETAAARALFYRRALAAWSFLLEMNEREALARLRELRELERTPLPIRFD
jgi:hypothetical protein